MIHFTCDMCKCELDVEEGLRYVVRVEVYAAMDATAEDLADERDHLEEIQDILERIDDEQDERVGDDVYQQLRFDLCPSCRRKFLKNPLGVEAAKYLNFSKN